MKKLLSLALSMVMVLGLFAGCVPKETDKTSDKTPDKEDVKTQGKVRTDIIVAWKGDIVSPDPHMMNDSVSQRVVRMMFERLVAIDKDEKVIPSLAESWKMASDSEYIFTIRKGVKFHNGDELKASDVKFSLDRARNSSFGKAFAGAISEVTVIDPYTVSVKTAEPYAPMLTNLALEHCSIVSEKVVTEKGDDHKLNPIGTGPMKFGSWKPNNEFVVNRFDGYWGTPAKATSITNKVYPEDGSRTIALETGEVDINFEVGMVDVPRLSNNDKITLHRQEGVNPVYLAFNTQKAPTDNLKFRQAMAHAINKQSIVDVVFESNGSPALSPIPTAMLGYYDPNIINYEYNPEKARKLLAESGYPSGSKVELVVGTEERNKMAQLIQDDCRQIGLTITVSVLEWGAFLEYVGSDKYQAMILGVSNRRDPEATFSPNFHSKNIGATGNRARYINPELDALIDQGKAELEIEKRIAIYHKVQNIIMENCVWQPLANKDNCVASLKGVQGIEYSAVESHNVHNVTVTE